MKKMFKFIGNILSIPFTLIILLTTFLLLPFKVIEKMLLGKAYFLEERFSFFNMFFKDVKNAIKNHNDDLIVEHETRYSTDNGNIWKAFTISSSSVKHENFERVEISEYTYEEYEE